MAYDSTQDTIAHIQRVQTLLAEAQGKLAQRAIKHDTSKLLSPEKEAFDAETPKLRDLTYGSEEYKAALARLGVALNHHYYVNRHHPEYHATSDVGELNEREVKDGTAIRRMTLLDLLEMACDWKAATERHANGNLYRSIDQNQERFGYTDELAQILRNTAREMGW